MTAQMPVDQDMQIGALRATMREQGVDLVALSPSPNMDWAVGFHPAYTERLCLLLVSQTGALFVMPGLDAVHFANLTSLPVRAIDDAAPVTDIVAAAIDELAVDPAGTIVIDETMRADHALILIDTLPRAARRSSLTLMGTLRIRKSPAELAALAAVAALNDRAMTAALAAVREGVSEREVLAAAEAVLADAGGTLLYQVVGASENGAIPHHHTGDRRLRAGDAIVIDLAGFSQGYYSDMTRMAVLGDAPEGYADVHAVVERAVLAGIAAARPGVRAHEIDDAARGVIADAGYGEYFVHRTGHGIGREVHEPPFITASSDTVIAEGMVFTIEPGIYLPGRFGIRLEEIVVIEDGGARVLSTLPRTVHRA